MSWNDPTKRPEYVIGIDTGTKTGMAIWNRQKKQFEELSTLPIHRALLKVKEMHEKGYKIHVAVEDARKAVFGRWGEDNKAKLQGAGSVKRDAVIWEDFLQDFGISHVMVRPNKRITKLGKYEFEKQTGYMGLTSSHSRDAAMLVYGM